MLNTCRRTHTLPGNERPRFEIALTRSCLHGTLRLAITFPALSNFSRLALFFRHCPFSLSLFLSHSRSLSLSLVSLSLFAPFSLIHLVFFTERRAKGSTRSHLIFFPRIRLLQEVVTKVNEMKNVNAALSKHKLNTDDFRKFQEVSGFGGGGNSCACGRECDCVMCLPSFRSF